MPDNTTNTTTNTTSATGNTMSGKSIQLNSDVIDGGEADALNRIKTVLEQGGMTVTGVTPCCSNSEGALYASGADYGLFLVGGMGVQTFASIALDHKGQHTFIIMGFQGWGGSTEGTKQGGNYVSTGEEKGASTSAATNAEVAKWVGQPVKNFFAAHSADIGYVEGKSPEEMAQNILSGNFNGGSSSGGSGVQIVEGFMTSGRGTSPQYYTPENYSQLTEIPFSEVSVTEEDYELCTAEFKSYEKIDLTSGRVYVLINGDPGQFGGFILKREFDSSSRMYTYTCQEVMGRVMANTVYAIYNKGKTVYDWLQEIYEDVGIPTEGFDDIEAYDNAVDPAYLEYVKNEEASVNAVENSDTETTPTDASSNSNSTSSSSTDTSGDGTSEETLEAETDENGDTEVVSNPFKKKPRGIYDKQTILDHTRTLLFDYGVHVRFYGDVTGVPIFKAYEKEEWLNTGWYLQPELGYKTNYNHGFDITNVVTQVGVKNIEALKPTGELYTSEELFGTNIASYFGRMGTIVDNPTPQGNTSAANAGTEETFVDADGNEYTKDQVIETNGYPSCSNDTSYNNGTKPEHKTYQKYWVNKCGYCKAMMTLANHSPGSEEGGDEGKTECDKQKTSKPFTPKNSTNSNNTDTNNTDSSSGSNSSTDTGQKGCGATFCQFCGKSLTGGGSLTEVTKKTTSTSSSTDSSSTSDSDSSSDTNGTSTSG